MSRRLLSVYKDEFRKNTCEGARKVIGYLGDILAEVDKPNFFSFNFGRGSKKEYFAVRCSVYDDLFYYFSNNANQGLKINFIQVKAGMMKHSFIKERREHEKSLSSILI